MATPSAARQDGPPTTPPRRPLPLLPPEFLDPDAWLTDLYGPNFDLDPLRETL
jgi:hypothetical protein